MNPRHYAVSGVLYIHTHTRGVRVINWDRFWSRVDKAGPDECWLWTGKPDKDGYGQYYSRVPGFTRIAHRLAYAYVHGMPSPELEIDHLCHDPRTCDGGNTCPHRACVNPAHLGLVTHKENAAPDRRANHESLKTHCPQGHPYSGDNLFLNPSGKRGCRTCQRANAARYRARRTAARRSSSS